MFSKTDLYRLINPRFIQRGQRLCDKQMVGDLVVYENDFNGMTEIETWVESESYEDEYQVRAVLGKRGNILTCSCTCRYYEDNFEPCKHIAAVLLEYIDQEESSIIGSGHKREPVSVTSDRAIQNLMNLYTANENSNLYNAVHVYPILGYDEGGVITVEFKIGIEGKHKYVIKNIDAFCQAIMNHESKHYGKELDFVHTLDAFAQESKPLVSFLMSLSSNDDSYLETNTNPYTYGYYAYTTPSMKRYLYLKGRYLDTFFSNLQNTTFFLSTFMGEIPSKLINGLPEIHTSIKKAEKGYTFSGKSYHFGKGYKNLYFLNDDDFKVYQVPLNKNTFPVFNFLAKNRDKPLFIAEEDLPKFSKYIFPVISTNTLIENDGFDPYDYAIATPEFEIYLDAPQKDMITCEVKAVYPDATYNILSEENENKRDSNEEKMMEQKIAPNFTSFDESNNTFVFHGKDDDMYHFLTETIPYLQSLSDKVFISDKLKRMTVRPAPKLSVGISVNHDLLQLNLFSSDLSLKDVASILSKYDRKKKFFRLKDGTFLNMENAEVNDLMNLKDSLSLTSKQIEKGDIEIPKFRALYLENLNNNAFNLEYDNAFRKMIQQMHAINEEQYEPPVNLNADLRHYQLDGMRWLCALRDNGFGGLLADEMGLGKTLQVIAMLGNWKNRKKTLIVCPASLVYNWNNEIDKFLPELPHRMIQGFPQERKQLIQKAADNEVLITSYELLRRDIEEYEDTHFSCQVIDEAQHIKNANTQNSQAVKYIKADFKIALTGTPIENKLSELWSIFDYLMPGFFFGYETFKKRFETPIVRDNDDLMQQELNQMITPFVLRRLKKDVLKDLPDKLEEVYYAKLDDEQKELYEAEVQKIKLTVGKQTDQEFKENKMMILAELTKLRQLCCCPKLLYDNYKSNSAKTDMCIDLIKNAIEGGHKILLFSQFTSMLDELTTILEKEKISYYLLEGKTPKKKRAEMVEAFQNDDVPIFLISLKAGGTGLNLTAADIVIHYDPWWNTAVENQASDRAHRIGQKNVVTVYKLIMKDTIEERILQLQNEKNDLANKILSGDGMSSAKLSREDLLALL